MTDQSLDRFAEVLRPTTALSDHVYRRRTLARLYDTSPAPGLFAGMRGEVAQRVEKVTGHLEAAIRAKVDRQGPPRSRSGEPPARDTGELLGFIRSSTALSGKVLTGTVAIGADHALDLEYGIARIAPRPFARTTLAEEEDAIVGILDR